MEAKTVIKVVNWIRRAIPLVLSVVCMYFLTSGDSARSS